MTLTDRESEATYSCEIYTEKVSELEVEGHLCMELRAGGGDREEPRREFLFRHLGSVRQ